MNQPLDPNLLKGNLELILLTILEEGEMYGLEIINEAQARTDGLFDFKINDSPLPSSGNIFFIL